MVAANEPVSFWCHDCRDDLPFDVVVAGSEGVPREWVCVACGAALVEAYDVASVNAFDVRGVA